MKYFLSVLIFFFLGSTVCDAQSCYYWKWGKADTTDVSGGHTAFTQHISAASGSTALWCMLQNLGFNYSSFYFGSYKLTEYDNAGNAGASATITGNAYLMFAKADAAGNWYVLGQYYDTVRFPGGSMLAKSPGSTTDPSYFLFKLNSGSLSVAWVKTIGADNSSAANTFEVTPSGVYMPVDSEYTHISRFDLATGARTNLFTQPFRSYTNSIAVDSHGNIYLTGGCAFSGIDFNGHVVTTTFAYPEYLVKYKADGTYSWHYILSDVTCTERKVTLAGDNNVYYSGQLDDTTRLDTFTAHHPAWVYDFIVARLDSNGHVYWLKQLKDTLAGDAYISNIHHAVGMADGSLSVLASLRGYIDWGNGVITNSISPDNDAAIINYSDGYVNWVKPVSGEVASTGSISTNGVDVWVTGNVYDSSRYMLDTIIVAVEPTTNTPYMAKLGHNNLCGDGVKDIKNNEGDDFGVMPVPAGNVLNIVSPVNVNGDTRIRLMDVSGRVVWNEVIKAGIPNYALDVAQYARGIYFMEFWYNHTRQIKKVVLQ